MNMQCKGYKFKKKKKKNDPSLGTICRVGAPQFSGIRASRIRFGPVNRVGSEKGRHSLVVSEPRFWRFWKCLGIGGSRIEYIR